MARTGPRARTPGGTGPWWPLAATIALLAVSNVMTNRVLPGAVYVPWNLAVAAALLWLALGPGRLTPPEVGVDPRDARSGVRWGLAAAGLVLAVYLIGAALPATRGLFEDERIGERGAWEAAFQTLVRIPLGTVVMEEIAFRGVLLGLVARRSGLVRGVVWSSLLFGVWHVLPSIGIEDVNPVLRDVFGDSPVAAVLAVALAVVGTGLAGLVFVFLRLRSRSLLAPILLHTAVNSLAFATAWAVIGLQG
ncbi:MAG: CPBP family intramembrane metalloprotease [Acidimicrobiales bacterium]|nr:CPBP family intramembrane metalloprotease [Acidimicrobiales bacterium]